MRSKSEGVTSQGSSESYARYQVWDVRFDWLYNFDLTDKLITKGGLSVLGQFTELESYHNPDNRNTITKQQENFYFPMVNATLGYQFTPELALALTAAHGHNGKGYAHREDTTLTYKLNSSWDVGLGYSNYQRHQDNSETIDDLTISSYLLKLGYSF